MEANIVNINGIEVHLIKRKEIKFNKCILSVNFGSLDTNYLSELNSKKYTLPIGMAHYVEHRLIYDDYGTEKELLKFYNDIKLATNRESTNYEFISLSNQKDDFFAKFGLLLNFIKKFSVTDIGNKIALAEVQKEISIQDRKLSNQITKYLLNILFDNEELYTDVAGSLEDVERISYEHLEFCRKHVYTPKNFSLFIESDIDDYVRLYKMIEDATKTPFRKSNYFSKCRNIVELNKNVRKIYRLNVKINQSFLTIGVGVNNEKYTQEEILKKYIMSKMIYVLFKKIKFENLTNFKIKSSIREVLTHITEFSSEYFYSFIVMKLDKIVKIELSDCAQFWNELIELLNINDFAALKKEMLSKYDYMVKTGDGYLNHYSKLCIRGMAKVNYRKIIAEMQYDDITYELRNLYFLKDIWLMTADFKEVSND